MGTGWTPLDVSIHINKLSTHQTTNSTAIPLAYNVSKPPMADKLAAIPVSFAISALTLSMAQQPLASFDRPLMRVSVLVTLIFY
jgi:hypothetical protein